MEMIDSHRAVAYTPAGLTTALSIDNGVDYVYLGADITIQAASGILMHPAKAELVLDGLYESVSPLPRTLSDQGGDDGTIRINTPSRVNLTLKNMIIEGRNYHGLPRVYDTAAAADVAVTYRNVTYRGPQMIWHVNGLTRYIDCDITIMYNGGSVVHEVAEVRWLEIGGRTVIRHNNGTGEPAFLFRKAGSYMTILEEAQVEITTDYDFLFRENDYPAFIIERGASLSLTTQNGISRSASHGVSSLTVGAGARFTYTRRSNTGGGAALYINGALTVEAGAQVLMQTGYAGSTRQLVYFSAGTGRGLYLNSPKSFVLYNRGGMALGFGSQTDFSLTGQQINYWQEAGQPPSAGTLEDAPQYQWHMPDWSAFTLEGTATSDLTTVQSAPSELPKEPKTEYLQLHAAQVLSVGELPLQVNPVIIESRSVTGSSDPEALVRVDYTARTVACRVECDVEDDSSFEASLVEEEEVPFGATVTVAANVPFLITTQAVVARYVEDMNLNAPETITFEPRPIAYGPVLLPRREEDPENPQVIVVTDSREVRTPWELWAAVEGPLATEDGDTLDDAVVFVPPEGGLVALNDEPQLLHADPGLEAETRIVWQPDRGLLARIMGPIRSGRAYTTRIFWELRVEEDVDPETEEEGDTP